MSLLFFIFRIPSGKNVLYHKGISYSVRHRTVSNDSQTVVITESSTRIWRMAIFFPKIFGQRIDIKHENSLELSLSGLCFKVANLHDNLGVKIM